MLTLLTAAALAAPLDPPDLVIDAIEGVYDAADDTVTLTVSVKNLGDENTGKFYVAAFSSKDWDTCDPMERDHMMVVNIAADQVQDVELTFPASHVDQGEPIHVFVDITDMVEELNEKNNTGDVNILDADPSEPEVVTAWFWTAAPECLVDTFDDNGWPIGSLSESFYAKLRIL